MADIHIITHVILIIIWSCNYKGEIWALDRLDNFAKTWQNLDLNLSVPDSKACALTETKTVPEISFSGPLSHLELPNHFPWRGSQELAFQQFPSCC